MTYLYKAWILVIFLTACNCVSANSPLPLEAYGALPVVQMVAISPDGKKMAYRKVNDTLDTIAVISLAEKKALFSIDVSSLHPIGIYFLNDNQVMIRGSKVFRIDGFRGKTDVSTAFLLDVPTKIIRQLLIPGENDVYPAQSGLGDIVGVSPDGNYVYMPAFTGTEYDDPKFSLLKVGIGKKPSHRSVGIGDFDAKTFFVDKDGNPIAREHYDPKTKIHKVLAFNDKKWVEIFREEVEIPHKSFEGVTPDGKSLVMLSTDEKTRRTSYNLMALSDGKISDTPFSLPNKDIATTITDLQQVVFGIIYDGFSPTYKFFDPALDKRMSDIMAIFPEQSVHLESWSPDWKHIIVNVQGSNFADDYYLFSEGEKAQFLTSGRPTIKAGDINPIGSVTYAARDELKIPTLLTIPRDKVNAIKNLPAILLPHGGPEAHDSIDFDWLAQALAAQGYLVIQPQFRGSNGFGADHDLAGRGEWGRKMQDDLTDAVKFFIAKGLVDAKHICIVGGSYGGYAALAGGAFTPELYRCVVSINGVSDLNDMLQWDKSNNGSNSVVARYVEEQFAAGEVKSKKLAEVSPQNYAKNFKASVLLIHAEKDLRVPIRQSEAMLSELKSEKKPATLIRLEGEDHHLSKGVTRQQTLSAIVQFVNEKMKD